MRKGIKSHWRPVYDSMANVTSTGNGYSTVLDLTNKRGKAHLTNKLCSWNNTSAYLKVTLDGVVIMNGYHSSFGGGAFFFQGEFDFENSFKVEHKGSHVGPTYRTTVGYYAFSV